MTIVIEDGGGRADAAAYADVAYADAHHALRGHAAWAAAATADKEAALVKATDALDASCRFRGDRLRPNQALAWPRRGAEDDSGWPLAGVPEAVRRACAELALRALSEELLPDAARGGLVASETVGPIEVAYAAGAPAGTVRRLVDGILAGVVRSGRDLERA